MQLTKQTIPTPALIVDLDTLDANITRAASDAHAAGKLLRPHMKAHKCVTIARKQIAAGASGMCVATLPEAELLTKAGISGLLLTSPLGDPLKIARAIPTGAIFVVDHATQVHWYHEAAQATGTVVDLLVDLDVGDHRTGAASLEQALELALAIDKSPNLNLRGVQAYSVSGSHGKDAAERRRISSECFATAREVLTAFASHGLETDILSGGSTGTWTVDLTLPEVTELQAGSYPLMDLAYKKIDAGFPNAMTVLASVISANHSNFVTIDAGFKAFSTDRPFGPEPLTPPGATYRWGGDEFGYIDTTQLRLGDRIELLPPHCDPTVNLYDRIYVCRGDDVAEVWPVMERSPA
ncbi:MAG TPA: alanine racemase [Bryobacteraceae bacterium]|nr:alanine racemase [Bryobacteraceae bacterium]